MILDLGTGDGRAAIALAELDPGALVIGIDADAASMAEVSRRAARPPKRGGRDNALFVVAAAESPPPELLGLADEVQVLFPWGSLLRGLLGRDATVAAGIATVLRPGGRVMALVSVAGRDRLADLPVLEDGSAGSLTSELGRSGLHLEAFRRATVEEVRATRSSWGRRLLTGPGDRAVWRLELVRASPSASGAGERTERDAAV